MGLKQEVRREIKEKKERKDGIWGKDKESGKAERRRRKEMRRGGREAQK